MSTEHGGTEDRGAARRDALSTLDRLVGTWAVGATGTEGRVSYAWFDDMAFLVQNVDLHGADGEPTRGVEYIRYDPDSGRLRSHYFGSAGEVLEYTYELSGDTLTIWFGDTDSPAKFVGTFDESGRTNTGAWQWPGGGYDSVMTRIEEPS